MLLCVSDREREDLEAHQRRQLRAPICKLLRGQTSLCPSSCLKVNLKHDNIEKNSHAYKMNNAKFCRGLVTRTEDSAMQVPISINEGKSPMIL